MMKEKIRRKKPDTKIKLMDMSYRKNINFYEEKTYSDEELSIIISELQKQMEQMESVRQKYYSMNSYIDRINKRTFVDILQEKAQFFLSKLSLNKKV